MKLVLLFIIANVTVSSSATFNYSGVVDFNGTIYRVKYMLIEGMNPRVSGVTVYPERAENTRWAVRFDIDSKVFFLAGPPSRPTMQENFILLLSATDVEFRNLRASSRLIELMGAKKDVTQEIRTLLTIKNKEPNKSDGQGRR